MFRGRRSTAAPTRDSQNEKTLAGGGWGSNSLSFSHAQSRNSHFTGGSARRFFAAITATLLVIGVIAGTVAGIGVTTASAATPLSVTTTSPLPLAPLNTPYSVTLAATGGSGSDTWSVASGSTLPSWLSLDATTGVLSGTPTTDATATFAVTVTDSASPADTATSGQLTLYAGNGGTQPFSLNMTSGSWTVLSTAPGTSQPFPAQTTTTLTGTVAPLTGAITDATLSLPVQNGVCSAAAGGCTNYIMTEADPGTATGQINSSGDITLNDSLSYTLDITAPITGSCVSSPVNLAFQSTAPYNTSTGDVTLSASKYTIPDFVEAPVNPSACGLALSSLNGAGYPYQVAGSTNNNTTLNLQGTGLPIPPPPGKATTNVLTASPTSPQLTTTSVTLTDTISSGGSTATAATGSVNFIANGAVVGTASVSNGSATYMTTTLPSQTNQLTAVYSGDFNYSGSTSPAVPYTIQSLPSVTLNLPTTVELSSPTPRPMSVTITNPSMGQTWSSNYLQLLFHTPLSFAGDDDITLDYQDPAGNWCPMTSPDGGQSWYFSGFGTPSCGTSPSSFALAPGTSITVNLEISIAYDPNSFGPGGATVKATLYNGDCTVPVTSNSSCTPSNSPFNSIVPKAPGLPSGAPGATGTFTMTYGARVPVSFSNNEIPTTPVPEGYLILPYVNLTAASDPYGILPSPTGTSTYLVDGTTVGTSSPGDTFYFTTAGLIPGTHTLTVEYSGDPVYAPSSYSQTFTVAPPAPGTPFVCETTQSSDPTLNASVVAVATVPSLAPSGSTVPVSALDLTLNIDPNGPGLGPVSNPTIGLSPGGVTITPPVVTPTNANGITSLSWTGLSATVPISGTPGSVVPVGVSNLSFAASDGFVYACSPADPTQLAVVQQVTVSGTTLTTSPSGSAAIGAPVTLTATVNPVPSDESLDTIVGQVDFFDGTTDLGTVPVPSARRANAGIATLTTTSLTPGQHTLTAVWSGGPTPAQTSAPVNFQVGTAPVIVTQPTNQTTSAGVTTTFTTTATGDPTPTFQWQLSTDGGTTWSNISGATSSSYTTPTTTASENGNQYQAIVSNPAGPAVTTHPATLTVLAPSTTGYRLVAANGAVSTFGNAGNYGSEAGQPLNAPIVGMTATPDNKGYWLVAADGGIFTFGDASYYGSEGGKHLNEPIVGIAATPDGKGYWLVAADGGIFTFGDAAFFGSEGGQHLNAPVVGMAATPSGNGYWLVASDGGIFTFGDAGFFGSEGGQSLNAPVVSMAATPDGKGYWLVAKDGGVFTFGDATFNGSASGQSNAPVIGLTPTSNGGGYWLGAQDGGIFTFGNAPFNGSGVGSFTAPVVGIAP